MVLLMWSNDKRDLFYFSSTSTPIGCQIKTLKHASFLEQPSTTVKLWTCLDLFNVINLS